MTLPPLPDSRFVVVVDTCRPITFYAEWRKEAAWLFGGLIVAHSTPCSSLSVLIPRQFRRRLAMENHLRLMVNTDGLTGIGGRRRPG
ncbi:hypothetical protein ACU4GD_20670 [Cupriavidus basilensis]